MLLLTLCVLASPVWAQLDTTGLLGATQEVQVETQELQPTSLFSQHSHAAAATSPTLMGADVVPFHWVITTCNSRDHWARFLASSLLSGVFHDLRPASISLVYCHTYSQAVTAPGGLPSLLYNLRHSPHINVFFPGGGGQQQGTVAGPDKATQRHSSKQQSWRVALTALLVPQLLGKPEWPLVVTEDDMLWAPNAHARLSTALQQVQAEVGSDPFYLSLYLHTDLEQRPADPLQDSNQLPQVSEEEEQQQQEEGLGESTGKGSQATSVKRFVTWGSQGMLLSPGMAATLRTVFQRVLLAQHEAASEQESHSHSHMGHGDHLGHAEHIVWQHLEQGLRCNQPGSTCHAFVTTPSLLQHIGVAPTSSDSATTSSGSGSERGFHLGVGFPVHVAFPGFEPRNTW